MPHSAKDLQLMELKDTVLQLNTLISTQVKTMDSLNKTIEELRQELKNQKAENDYLKSKLFGSSSEKTPFPGQLHLFMEDAQDDRIPVIIEPEEIKVTSHKRVRKPKATYEEMFAHLPHKVIPVDALSEEERLCPICDTLMEPIGKEVVRTELKYYPAKLERIDYVATTYACPECKDSLEPTFVKDVVTEPLVPHSYVSSGLAAHVMYAKFINALPYYRQEKDFFNQFGVKIPRGTMAHWTIFCAQNYLKPILNYLAKLLNQRRFVAADETPIQVLKEEGRRAQTKSYVWLFRSGEDGNPPIILFQYHPTRNGDAASEFFREAASVTYLMVDGYAGYNKLKQFHRCSCYAHIRRYFVEAIPKGKETDYQNPAVQGMLYCNKLFEYERSYRMKGLSYKQIQKRRLKDQKPVIEAFLSWAEIQIPVKGSRLAKAITYVLNQKPYMMTYLEDGRCSLSNQMSENAIRPVTVGRKNWLFCDSTEGAEASMAVYSLLETARANGLNSLKYLEFLLEARPNDHMTEEELKSLTPWSTTVQEYCINQSE